MRDVEGGGRRGEAEAGEVGLADLGVSFSGVVTFLGSKFYT